MAHAKLQLAVLGPTELRYPGTSGATTLVGQPKRLALLVYLALATSDGYRRRDAIVAMFWPDLDQKHGRLQLRKALSALRKDLGAGAIAIRGNEEVRLEPDFWCDAVAFRRHLEAGQWTEALALFRGDLLDGLFPDGVGESFHAWLDEQRRSLRFDAARAAWECSAREDLAGRRAEALALARRAAELDADGEESVRRYIALLDRYGDRSTALNVFTQWERRLAREYGVAPSPETRWLGRRIQSARKGDSSETPDSLRRLLWPPVPNEESGDGASPAPSPPSGPRRASFRIARVGGGAVGAALLVAAGWLLGRRGFPADAMPRSATVAVLPFRGLGDSADMRVAATLAEELTLQLARMDSVVARSAVRERVPAEPVTDASEAGRRFGVAHVVDGSVRHAGRRIRVALRLLRARDGVTVWAQSFDVDTTDAVMEVQLARQAADSLRSFLLR